MNNDFSQADDDNELVNQDSSSDIDCAKKRFMQALDLEADQLKQQEVAEIQKMTKAKTLFQAELNELASLEKRDALENVELYKEHSEENAAKIKLQQVNAESQLDELKRNTDLKLKSLQSDSSRLMKSKLEEKKSKLRQLEQQRIHPKSGSEDGRELQ